MTGGPGRVQNIFGEKVLRPLKKGQRGVGCEYCPLDKMGVNKVKGLVNIRQRRAMVWGMCPGKRENEQKLALVGAAGKLLWETCALFGLERNDFDIQNVVRCLPLERDGSVRDPSKDELRCCSIYNEEAVDLNRGAAKVHLILGEVAGRQLLKKQYRKDTPLFWHTEWECYVVICRHPSSLLGAGGKDSGSWVYREFCDRIKAVANILKQPKRWGYVAAQDYGEVRTEADLDRLLETIQSQKAAGSPIGVDLEDGEVNGQKHVPLTLGISWGDFKDKKKTEWSGGARSVLLEHPDAKLSPKLLSTFKEKLAKVIVDPKIKKGFQHGAYDQPEIERYFKTKLRGYEWDSQYTTYFYDSSRRNYGLDDIIRNWFMEFQDYKTTMVREWSGNFSNAPLSRLVPYNCADADITLRAIQKFKSRANPALMKIYIAVSFVLDDMETRGPFLDWEAHARLSKAVPEMLEPLTDQLRIIAEDPMLNPGTPQEIAKLLYDKKHFPKPTTKDGKESRSTHAEYLKLFMLEYDDPTPELVLRWRALSTVKNTFLEGWERSAKKHGGLRTHWFLTGAATGRLRSGGGEDEAHVNLQNTHGNPLMQNLLVSDPNWREALTGSI